MYMHDMYKSSSHVLIIGIGIANDVLLFCIKLPVDPCNDSGPGADSSSDEEGVEEEGVYACAEEELELSFHIPQLPPVNSPLQFCCDFAKLSLPDEMAVISPAVTI